MTRRVSSPDADPDATGPDDALERLVREIRACTACAHVLPLGPRPVLHVSATARILIASQAPGTRVHETGQSFNDASGDRLRGWLGIDRATFYDASRIAIMPMGMCYPGRMPRGGDRPPRRECAPLWRDRVLALMPEIRLTLLVGSYAQVHVLGPGRVEDRVRHYRDFLPRYFPLPHPSWRTGAWERRSPWFGAEVLPALRMAVHALL
ncbi:uracil-DNA glycosylase family protein [Novacetimonas pomaceti]|uniref:uracil-DNA glycosylase family protein n=1 Tax=Novacetimonas pomaceti TaxID=2021998 RepID=UPI001C2DC76E|nr:uracil-DNA glycosylase family protein [Novacetimonas pomaceti]MBV1834746.1 uracil-DNA glycosylase family protein [Novacetimonas pomaceti]